MSEVVSLKAEIREDLGTSASRRLRKKGLVPAVVYNNDMENIAITVEEKEMTKYFRLPAYASRQFEIEVNKKKIRVTPKETQLHPITDLVHHVDFTAVSGKTHKMSVPIIYKHKDTCVGVKRGGYFNRIKRFLQITAPSDNLPRTVEINVENMNNGDSITAASVKLPEGCKLAQKDTILASLIGKKGKSIEEETTTSEESSGK